MRFSALLSLLPVLALGACSSSEATPPIAGGADAAATPDPQSAEEVKPVKLAGSLDDCPEAFKDAPPKAGWNRGFEVAGQKRDFWAIFPEGEPTDPQPVFVGFNGTSEDGKEFSDRAELATFAKRGMVVLAPSSIGNGERWPIWDSLRPEGKENDPNKDIEFVDTLLKCVSAHRALDKNRVYGGGHSAGGIFTNNIIQRRSELFAGVIVASGLFSGTSPVPPPTMDKTLVIVTWGGNNDKYTGKAGTATVTDINFAPEASAASKFYSTQKNVGHAQCGGNNVGHAWLDTLNNWFIDLMLAHPKGFLKPEALELAEVPANAGAKCSTAPYEYVGNVKVACGTGTTDGCKEACQFFASCGYENDGVRGVLLDELNTLGFKGGTCAGCLTRCAEKATDPSDADVLACLKGEDASGCGQGIAGALPLPTALGKCCNKKTSSGYCKDVCTVIKGNSTALGYFPICNQF